MTVREFIHFTEGVIECSCKPLVLTVGGDGSISRIAGGPLEESVDTGPTIEEMEQMAGNADYRAGYRAGRRSLHDHIGD